MRKTPYLAILPALFLMAIPIGAGCIETAALLRSLAETTASDMPESDDSNAPVTDDGNPGDQNDAADDSSTDGGSEAVDGDGEPGEGDGTGDEGDSDNDSEGDDANPDDMPDDSADGDSVTDSSGETEGVPPLPDGAELVTSATGVQTFDFVVGDGAAPDPAGSVRVGYTGYLEKDGTIFDSNESIVFGLNSLIPGFTEGVVGMREGGMRRIIIPPDQGYGPNGNPGAGIGGEDVIIFDVELQEALP